MGEEGLAEDFLSLTSVFALSQGKNMARMAKKAHARKDPSCFGHQPHDALQLQLLGVLLPRKKCFF